MSHADGTVLVGVDAGGSKTTAWVAIRRGDDDEPERLGCGRAGAANVRAMGIVPTGAAIESAIDRALTDAGFDASHASEFNLCIAAAGAGRDAEQRQLHTWATGCYPAAKIRVTHDAHPILAAASDDLIGVALIGGTGSFAWGRNRHGEERRCGGWGYLFGDEGSGYAIGIAALRAVAQAADGRADATPLGDAVLDRFELRDPVELVEVIYGESITRAEIARLSELVFAHADDPAAAKIIRDAADSLADLVNTLTRQLDLDADGATLAVSGGMLVHQPVLLRHVCEGLEKRFARIASVQDPVAGAVQLANRL